MARILDESFEGTGYENVGWTETVDAGCTLDKDSTEKTPPNFGGNQTLKAIVLDATYANAYAVRTLTNQNISYIRAYIYVDAESFADNNTVALFRLEDSNVAAVCAIQFRQVSGAYGLRLSYYSGGVYNNTALAAINLDTWYRVEVQYDLTNMLWEWKIDGVSKNSGNLTSTTKIPTAIRVGIGGSPNGLTVHYDLVGWDDTTWCGSPVQKLPTLKYDVRQLANKLPTLKYDVFVPINKLETFNYDAFQLATKNPQFIYDIIGIASKLINLKYDIYQLTGKELQLLYDIFILYLISGYVKLSGAGVNGAIVRCVCMDDESYAGDTTTNADGFFEITGLVQSYKYHILVEYTSGGTKYNTKSLWDISPVAIY